MVTAAADNQCGFGPRYTSYFAGCRGHLRGGTDVAGQSICRIRSRISQRDVTR